MINEYNPELQKNLLEGLAIIGHQSGENTFFVLTRLKSAVTHNPHIRYRGNVVGIEVIQSVEREYSQYGRNVVGIEECSRYKGECSRYRENVFGIEGM